MGLACNNNIYVWIFQRKVHSTVHNAKQNGISSGPIIMDPASADKVDPAPKVIIPKINVDVPVVYNIQSKF